MKNVRTQLMSILLKLLYKSDRIFTNPELNMTHHYAKTMKSMFLSVFYASMFPLAGFIGFIGLAFDYWMTKVILFII